MIGNHDLCPSIIEFSNETFGGVNYFELVNNHLLIFLNTSFNSKEEAIDAYKYLNNFPPDIGFNIPVVEGKVNGSL